MKKVETVNDKRHELTPEELKQITGGVISIESEKLIGIGYDGLNRKDIESIRMLREKPAADIIS